MCSRKDDYIPTGVANLVESGSRHPFSAVLGSAGVYFNDGLEISVDDANEVTVLNDVNDEGGDSSWSATIEALIRSPKKVRGNKEFEDCTPTRELALPPIPKRPRIVSDWRSSSPIRTLDLRHAS
ncbi:MAG TPA: hypothetical protein VMD74_02555 [Candidatus Methylomirabilis sp.]|nr:hypothetical protein [Candidatus Methylomirabilis sp.]